MLTQNKVQMVKAQNFEEAVEPHPVHDALNFLTAFASVELDLCLPIHWESHLQSPL